MAIRRIYLQGIPILFAGRARQVLAALFILLATPAFSGSPPVGSKSVLLFYASDRRGPFAVIEDEVIRERLINFRQRVEVFSQNFDPLLDADYYRRKYRDRHFDVIVCDRAEALTFVVNHRAEVFGNSPVVFHSFSDDSPALEHLPPGITGVKVDRSALPSFDLIRHVQPETNQVVVILGASDREVRAAKLIESEVAPVANGIAVDFWQGLTADELRSNLQKVSPRAVALYVSSRQDREGRAMVSRDVLAQIAASSKVPIYSTYATYLGMGAVGGALIDPARAANAVADLVEQILNGQDLSNLKPRVIPRRIAFDARQLKRYRIAESRLPPGSEVLFRVPSAWDLSRPYLLAGLLFLLLETALVAILLIQRRRARRAQTLLERRFDMERVISEYATRLSSCPAQRVDGEIERGLQAVLEVEKLDLASWVVSDETAPNKQRVYSARSNSFSSESLLHNPAEMASIDRSLSRGEALIIQRLEELPAEAQSERAYLEQKGIKSLVCIPSSTGDDSRAALVLACREKERSWPRTLVNRLGVVGNIFANALMRKRAQEAGQQSERRFRSLFTDAPIGIALEDLDGKLLFVNPALCSMLGYTMEEMTRMTCAQFSEAEDHAEDLEQFQKLRAGTIQGYHIEKRYHRRDGVPMWGRLNVSLIKGAAEPAVVLAMVEDVTEKKATVEDLMSAHSKLQVLTQRLLAAQEEERKRIARELHDDIGQRLSLLMMELDVWKNEMPVERTLEQSKLHSLLGQLDELITDVHNMSHDLHSSKLQHLGLNVALKEICRRVSTQRQVAIELRADPLPHPLPEEVALCFYRVAQEALNNAARHSGSARIEVRLTSEGQLLRMQIRDYGIGFDLMTRERGLGLATMLERLKTIGGRLAVHSSVGNGTELVAEADLRSASAAVKVA